MSILLTVSAFCIALAFLIPFSIGPLSTLHLELLAALGWLGLAAAHFGMTGGAKRVSGRLRLALLIPGSLVFTVLAELAVGRFAYPGIGLVFLMYFVAAACALWFGWQVVMSPITVSNTTLKAVAYAVLGAALLNGIAAFLQYMNVQAPPLLVAQVPGAGRVFGNLRQANLYSLLIVLGVVCLMGLGTNSGRDDTPSRSGPLKWSLLACAAFLGASASLSLSRTGAVMLWAVLAAAWAGAGLHRFPKMLAVVAAASHGIAWGVITLLEQTGSHRYEILATIQLTPGGGNFTSFRSEIWSGMVSLIVQHPLLGVGTGNAGYAYFMTDLPARIDLNLQHAHNLPLQIAVEHGAVFGLAWLILIGTVLWRSRSAWTDPTGRTIALAMIAFAIHSNLEYPLWYLFFLIPCAFAVGAFTAISELAREGIPVVPLQDEPPRGVHWLPVVGVTALTTIAAVAWDYQRILPTFRSSSYEQAIVNLERGYGTVLFTHWMDYAVISNVAVTPENASKHYDLTKRLSRVVIQPFTLTNLALAAAMLGKVDESAFYLRRIGEMSGTGVLQVLKRLTPEERIVLAPAVQKLYPAQR